MKTMSPFVFRKATLVDLEEIVQLLADDDLGKEREKPMSKMNPAYKTAFDQILADPNQLLMVVEKDKRVAGTCHLTLMPSLTFQGSLRMNIEAVRVDSSLRGQGIGEWMFDRVIGLAKVEGCKIIQLTTNKNRMDALRFYEKLGFKATHEGMKLYL
jgi:ribosomal protein S18 acetylase RimI-like enzyme